MEQQQVDLSREASVRLQLHQWNALLGVLRIGSGPGINWEMTHPLLQAISTQLQQGQSNVVPLSGGTAPAA